MEKFQRMQNRIIKHKLISITVMVMIAFVLGGMIELLCNYSYFLLPRDERGLHALSINDLTSNAQLTQNEDGSIVLDGSEAGSCYLTVNHPNKILDLSFEPDKGSPDFFVLLPNGSKKYYVASNSQVKDTISLKYDSNGNQNKVYIWQNKENEDMHWDSSQGTITIRNLMIDNRFEFNYSRLELSATVLLVFLLFLGFWSSLKKNIPVAFLILSIAAGINLVFLIPTYFSFDEKQHFVRAYNIASLNINMNTTDQPIAWPDDIDQFLSFDGLEASFDTIDEKDNYLEKFGKTTYTYNKYIDSTASTYLPIAYIPAALGIALGKLCHLPFVGIYYLGRLFNALTYSLIVFWALKGLKYGQRLMSTLGLVPAVLFLTGTYSADPMTLAFAFAAVSVFIKMLTAPDHTVGWKPVALFTLFCALVCTCKMTYAPLILLLFAVGREKFITVKKNKLLRGLLTYFIPLIVVVLVALGCYVYSQIHGLVNWNESKVDVHRQIMFIVSNPYTFLMIFVQFFTSHCLIYLNQATVNLAYCGSLSGFSTILMLFGIALFSVLDNETSTFVLKRKTKGILFLTVLVTALLIVAALYLTFNSVGSSIILGVQARYFYPLVLPFLLCFRTPHIQTDFTELTKNTVSILFSSIFILYLLLFLFTEYSS